MAKKMKFAVRPASAPGPDEIRTAFVERMGATGNVAALDEMLDFIDAGGTYEAYRASKQESAK